MILATYRKGSYAPFKLPEGVLQRMPCGLHRANLTDAYELMPELAALFATAPVDCPEEWEVDVKIHMLMQGQYPCIPNWHCDNVKRDESGKLEYGFVDSDSPPMLLWVSNAPVTLFLAETQRQDSTPENHGELHKYIEAQQFQTRELPEQTWCWMPRNAPHRGQQCLDKLTWRIFVRLTHKSILPARPVVSEVRRHAQVYLPHDFHW